jgi:hypothetical protein
VPAGSGAYEAAPIPLKSGSRARLESAPGEPPSKGANANASAKVRSIPPLDPTAPRTRPRIPIPRSLLPTPRPRPILASEGLLDDAAPIEPYARGSRILDVLLGALMIACGVVLHLASPKTSSIAMYGAGAAVALFAFVRRYGMRAMLVLLAATAGWLPALIESPTLSFVGRSIAPVVLATALFLRAVYRGDRFVRAMLVVGIAGFAACALGIGGAWVWLPGVSLGARLVAGAMGAASLLAMLGFMNEQTTGGSVAWGIVVLLVSALAPFAVDASFTRASIAAVVGNASGLAIATLALFQLGALFVAPRARVRVASRSSLPMTQPEEEEAAPPEDG